MLLALAQHGESTEAGLGCSDGVRQQAVGQQFEELLLDTRREECSTAGHHVERRKIVRLTGLRVSGDECVEHRTAHRVTRDEDQVDLVLVDVLPHLVGVEFRVHQTGSTAEEAVEYRRLRTAVNHRRDRVADHARVGCADLRHLVLVLDRNSGDEVDASAENTPPVLVTPHDALGTSGGAAGVEHEDVVVAALFEITLTRTLRECVLVADAESTEVQIGAVLDHDDGLDLGSVRQDVRDLVRVAALVNERNHVGVVEDVLQLVLDVPVIDVDHHGPDLENRDHGLDRLDDVPAVDADLVTRLNAMFTQVVTEAVCSVLQLCISHLAVVRDQRNAVRNEVDCVLYEVCDVKGHEFKVERVTVSGKTQFESQLTDPPGAISVHFDDRKIRHFGNRAALPRGEAWPRSHRDHESPPRA